MRPRPPLTPNSQGGEIGWVAAACLRRGERITGGWRPSPPLGPPFARGGKESLGPAASGDVFAKRTLRAGRCARLRNEPSGRARGFCETNPTSEAVSAIAKRIDLQHHAAGCAASTPPFARVGKQNLDQRRVGLRNEPYEGLFRAGSHVAARNRKNRERFMQLFWRSCRWL
jgi:hypothetical protein